MAISRFSNSSIANGFPKYQKFWDGSAGLYTGETQSGGAGYSNTGLQPFSYATRADTSLTRDASGTLWTGSNQGTYFGGIQSVSLGGAGNWHISLNNGNAVPAGTYNFTATVYLDLNNQNTSHDGGYFWLVTPTKK